MRVRGLRRDPALQQQNPPALVLHLQQIQTRLEALLISRDRCQAGMILASPQGWDRLCWVEIR